MRLEFSAKTKRDAHARAKGKCQQCGVDLCDGEPQYHHILEARLGGDNSLANCFVVCIPCHKAITKSQSTPRLNKMRGQFRGSINAKPPPARKLSGRCFPPGKSRDPKPMPPRRNPFTRQVIT